MRSYTVALALGLLLNGGWASAGEESSGAPVTVAVTDDNGPVSTSHDWVAYATFRGAGRVIELVSIVRYATEGGCLAFLQSPPTRAGLMLVLAELQEIDPEATMTVKCAQLGIPA